MKEHVTIICHRIACQFNRYCRILESKVDWVPGNFNRTLFIPIVHSLSSNAGLEPIDVNYKQNRLVSYFGQIHIIIGSLRSPNFAGWSTYTECSVVKSIMIVIGIVLAIVIGYSFIPI